MPDYFILFSIVFLRVIIGLRFIFPGWMMIMRGPLSAKEYLEKVEGPFSPFFKKLAKNKTVDYLNKWGLFLIGLLLVFGVLVRPAALLGILLMVLYWLTKYPWHESVIDERLLIIGILLFLIAAQAGILFGMDYLLLQIPFVSEWIPKFPWILWLL